MRVFVALGSNLGDRRRYLLDAVAGLPGVAAISPVFETEPVGGPDDQDWYLNCVVELNTDLGPRELLEVCRSLERAAGRERRDQWEPRTLDIDILLMEGVACREDDLIIPHPRMYERRFVLAPLRALAPELVTEGDLERSEGEIREAEPLLS